MAYQILTCPNCNGTGCPTCKNTGKIRVAEDQLQKLKTMVGQITPSPTPQSPPLTPSPLPKPNRLRFNTNLAGIIAFSILSIIAGAGAASWYFLKALKPFFAGLISLLTFIGTRFAWQQPFFQPHEPNDFLKAIKRPV